MPSKPRIPTEPTLEELSAYLDHELDAGAQARVADHVAGCADCRTRLEGLRQTAYAVRALPMATPARAFTIPAQRRQAVRWAPAGWIGGVAAALIVVIVGVNQLHVHGPGAASSTSAISGGPGGGANSHAAPANQFLAPDRRAGAASKAVYVNATTVVDPRDASRTLTVSTDARTYPSNGTLAVQVQVGGLASNETTVVRLLLERNGYAVELPTGSQGSGSAAGFQASYALANLPLSRPVSGSYTLTAIEQLPGGSGATLVARLPITISG